MTQLATMVPPTKRAKQKAPKRIIMRGSVRWVIAEDDRGEEREEKDCSEVRDGHERFLPVASEWASTAEMMFRRPATTMNFVP